VTVTTEAELGQWLQRSPFVSFLNPELVSADPATGTLSLRAKLRAEFERSSTTTARWHGGVISALADTASSFALIMMRNAAAPTVNIRVDYLRPAVGNTMTATAVVRRAGKSIAFVDVDILADDDRLVAVARANFATAGSSAAASGEGTP
jgi:uncharacterized protein (TIGR00369 family)